MARRRVIDSEARQPNAAAAFAQGAAAKGRDCDADVLNPAARASARATISSLTELVAGDCADADGRKAENRARHSAIANRQVRARYCDLIGAAMRAEPR